MKLKWFYSTDCPGTGGKIKRRYSDFIVEEKRKSGYCETKAFWGEELKEEELVVPEKTAEFLHLDLEKVNKDLNSVLRDLSRRMHFSAKRIGYAGMKDKRAITCQRISIWEPDIKAVESIKLPGIRIRNPAWENEKIDLGKLEGNRFTITIRDIELERKELEKRVNACIGEMSGGIANVFGEQRFGGIREISHLVGKQMVLGKFEEAVMIYLTEQCELEDDEVRDARAIAASHDFKRALMTFPVKYRYERAMLNALLRQPGNYIEALRALPPRLRFLFTHAYQSYFFNEVLRERKERGISFEPIEFEPQEDGVAMGLLPGCESSFSPGEIGLIEREIMKRENMSFADFKIGGLRECSSRGSRRKILFTPEEMELLKIEEDSVFEDRLACTVRFGLPKGSYATVVLNEITKNPNPKFKSFELTYLVWCFNGFCFNCCISCRFICYWNRSR